MARCGSRAITIRIKEIKQPMPNIRCVDCGSLYPSQGVPFRCQDDGVSAVLNIQEFPRGRSISPTGKDRLRSRLRPSFSLYAFSYKSRNDMGALKIKIISRPVEIYRHEEDTIKAILLTISLRLNQQHLLGKPVGSVGLFRATIP